MQKSITSILQSGSFEAPRSSVRRWLALPVLSLACALVAGTASAQEAPPLDEDLQFLLDNGFESFIFAQTCRSVGDDGSVIDVEPLPVGNGRHLECETEPARLLQTIDTLSSTGERFCAIGQVVSVTGGGDDRLSVSVVSTPDGGPWSLLGTREGEEITISRVTGPGGGTAFPLIADAIFDVFDIQPNPDALLCDQVFGL